MWKSIAVNQQTRFMKYVRMQDCHKVYFSDVVNVWMEELTSESLSRRCKEMNSLVEAEPEILAKHVYTLIVDGEEGSIVTSSDHEETKKLNIESQLAGIPFYFMFKMQKMDAEMVCKEVTYPLMSLAINQQSLLRQLQNMIIAKDAEIQQYKLEGAVLKKRKVETEPFYEGIVQHENAISSHTDDITTSVRLFAKLCSQLPPVLTVQADSCARKIEEISPESEQEPASISVEHLTANVESPIITERKDDVKPVIKKKFLQNKKAKLRI